MCFFIFMPFNIVPILIFFILVLTFFCWFFLECYNISNLTKRLKNGSATKSDYYLGMFIIIAFVVVYAYYLISFIG